MPSKKDTQKAHTKKKGAPYGNQNNRSLKDKEAKTIAYDSYCAHLAKGKSKRSWFFEDKGLRCTWETMEKYLIADKDNIDFDPVKKSIAEAKGYAYWEEIAENSAKMSAKETNTASIQMIMRNKFGWDKEEKLTPPNITINCVDYSKWKEK